MRTIRIYQAGNYQCGDELTLLPQASLHVGVVLRMQPSEKITLFNGEGQESLARILSVTKKAVHVRIDSLTTVSRESPLHIHLAPGVIKGDGMEWLIQKAVELGVSSISPLLTQHSAVKQDAAYLTKKHAQWQAIAVSACEQSGRNTLPRVHAPVSFHIYLQQPKSGSCWLLDPSANTLWQEMLSTQTALSECHLIVGPEGGLHPLEIQQANAALFHSLHLGPRILRAETASIAALSILQALRGDL